MMLYVNGQDIGTFVLGIVDDRVHLENFRVGPEGYLATLESFLDSEGLRLDAIEGIILVTGPGSPTALRASLSIVNTIHFTKRIPVMVLEKDPHVPDGDVVTKDVVRGLSPLAQESFAKPIYANGPRITASKKDALGRSL